MKIPRPDPTSPESKREAIRKLATHDAYLSRTVREGDPRVQDSEVLIRDFDSNEIIGRFDLLDCVNREASR